jgi:hypothetical protein
MPKDPKITYRVGVTRDERGIESQSAEDAADDRRSEKWDAEGPECNDE